MFRYAIRPLAWREIDQHLDYLEAAAGLETAERFFTQLLATCDALAEMPRMGVLCGFHKRSTHRLRRFPVHSFENWPVFYQPQHNGVEIIRIIHGARDIEALLN